ncbi:helix-turn-helix domain-containing protein [Rhizobium oryzicola]|uniref:Helix-turn-helix transcriptional regulator n=1 Tax=Rhizobium oryzicola TaxID=1232668 RepID=A0ABT8SUG4_9HYPH|nr:helix-turn-helix transcriptional regulator [Rhizobium oryzicola]MDO1582075.1 helix-turn-helix transcriptional regulator [Rhizobium oryzicola]
MTISLNHIDHPNAASVAQTIASARQAAGYSLEDVAVTSGLTVSEIEAIERGRDHDESRVRRLASALQVPSLMR